MAEDNGLVVAMQSFSARHKTFEVVHRLNKRRASANSGKKRAVANTIEWPHETPSTEDLARAGFFFRPDLDTPDNVQCFLCAVKLDGWDPTDDPIDEHVAHSRHCAWALSLQAGHKGKQLVVGGDVEFAQDPMSDELAAARRRTFNVGGGWPHEGKRGWKCKVSKMVEAGWCFDPAHMSAGEAGEEEESDGVTCFYCTLSLDGWEPKDDPAEEHRRRSPECAFFALMDKFGGGAEKKPIQGKGKKGAGRASAASKASSRMSTQSAMSTTSQEPSLEAEAEEAAIDDSIVTTASQATATGTTKTKKKGTRSKAAAKGAKGRKRANTADSQANVEPMYPVLKAQNEHDIGNEEEMQADIGLQPITNESAPLVDNGWNTSTEISSQQKKPAKGRKAKGKATSTIPVEHDSDISDVSAQLQEELDRSIDLGSFSEQEEATPQPEEPVRLGRGTKRTSEGLRKVQSEVNGDVSAVLVEFPVPPSAAAAPKGKRARQASKQVAAVESTQLEDNSQHRVSTQDDVVMSEVETTVLQPAKATIKAKKVPPAKGKGKGRKASSTRSSRSSKATATTDTQPQLIDAEAEQEDLERDEREIEAELERIAAEQAALQAEQEKAAEYEPSPSHRQYSQVHETSTQRRRSSQRQSTRSPAPQLPPLNLSRKHATPSPTGSDKENQLSSDIAPTPAAKRMQQPPPQVSPVKALTTRIPLAPGTPNRPPLSPRKLLSPSKTLDRITSTTPWEPIDLETVLLTSPQPTPGTLAARLAGAADGLSSPEKGLTVEGWVRWKAERAEEELRRKCEQMVGVFEREGVRALGVVGGVVVGHT